MSLLAPRTLRLALTVVAAPLASGCIWHGFHARAHRTETAEYPLSPQGAVELSTFNGRIKVLSRDEPGVRLERTLVSRARTVEAAEAGLALVAPEVESAEHRLRFQVHHPRSAWHRFQADLVAWVPEGAQLSLRTSNGEIEVTGVGGDIAARTSNGRIVLGGCSGGIEAVTSNGAVRIDCGLGVGASGIEVETSNGGVRCVLPETFAGEIDARTSNGRVRCDFPVAARQGGARRTRLLGQVGEGGPPLRLRTSNGSVEIRRAGAGTAPTGRNRRDEIREPRLRPGLETRKV